METTVTGLFTDANNATKARAELLRDGFSPDAVTMLTRDTENLHALLGEETSDAARGATLGGVVGAIGMAIGAAAMALPPVSVFAAHWGIAALVGGVCGGVAGALIGFLVGSATGHQVQDEYEHSIEGGGQVLAINTDGSHAARAHAVLQRFGGQHLSTAVHRKHHSAKDQAQKSA